MNNFSLCDAHFIVCPHCQRLANSPDNTSLKMPLPVADGAIFACYHCGRGVERAGTAGKAAILSMEQIRNWIEMRAHRGVEEDADAFDHALRAAGLEVRAVPLSSLRPCPVRFDDPHEYKTAADCAPRFDNVKSYSGFEYTPSSPLGSYPIQGMDDGMIVKGFVRDGRVHITEIEEPAPATVELPGLPDKTAADCAARFDNVRHFKGYSDGRFNDENSIHVGDLHVDFGPSIASAQPNAGDLMERALKTYRERNALYGNSYHHFGNVMAALFPNGLPANLTTDDWNRLGVLNMIVSKLIRYAANFSEGGHADSAHDMGVYSFMLEELNEVPF